MFRRRRHRWEIRDGGEKIGFGIERKRPEGVAVSADQKLEPT
jgi:hypothetical protein